MLGLKLIHVSKSGHRKELSSLFQMFIDTSDAFLGWISWGITLSNRKSKFYYCFINPLIPVPNKCVINNRHYCMLIGVNDMDHNQFKIYLGPIRYQAIISQRYYSS